MDLVLRAVVAFAFVYLLTRVIGRRELSSMEPFDLIMLVVGASGAVSNVKTVRAYTGAEFKAAQEKAGTIASSYKPPAK